MYENLFDLNNAGKKDFTEQLKEISIKDTFLHETELNKNIQKVFSSVGETPTKEQSELLFGLAGITPPQVGVESFGSNVALEAGLLKKLKGLFKQSQTKKLKAFSSGQWSKVQKDYISFLNNLKSEIEKSDVEEYKLDNIKRNGVKYLPYVKDSFDIKRLDQAFKDYIELRDTAVEYFDFTIAWYKKNMFIKDKSWSSDDVARLEKEFEQEALKKFKFDSIPKWVKFPPQITSKPGFSGTVKHFESLTFTKTNPYLGHVKADTYYDIDYYEGPSQYTDSTESLTVSKDELLKLIALVIDAVSKVVLEPLAMSDKVTKLENSVGFSFHPDGDKWITDEDWNGSIGEKYFKTWEDMFSQTTKFTHPSEGMWEWYDYTDIHTIENATKVIAILVDKN